MTWVVWGAIAFFVVDIIAVAVLVWGARTAEPDPAELVLERRIAERRGSDKPWAGPERRRADRRGPWLFTRFV